MKYNRLLYKIDMIDRWRLHSFLAKYLFQRSCTCLFCNNKFHNYHFHGYNSEAAEIHNVSCMGIRRSDCPYCGSSDKNRWLWWVIKNKTDIPNGG